LFGNLATGHFSGKIFSKVCIWGDNGSNDIGLYHVKGPNQQTHKQTNFEYLSEKTFSSKKCYF
jgi:hypothetical protein